MRAYNAIIVGGFEIGILIDAENPPVFTVKMGDPFSPEQQELDVEDLDSILTFIKKWKRLLAAKNA